MNLFDWLEQQPELNNCDSTEFMYDHMESQSNKNLPVIYKPFDIDNESHWIDRGYILDFYLSVGDGRILDFGAGDGWPSLAIAPFVNEVIGVEASVKRVETCRQNAARLTIDNIEFVHVPVSAPLPFEDNSFDGIVAASSIEQTPNPGFALRELYRVLKPGGKLRMYYESLSRYRNGLEKEILSWQTSEGLYRVDIYNRNIETGIAEMYSLEFDKPHDDIVELLKTVLLRDGLPDNILDRLKELEKIIRHPQKCTLSHPDGKTWLSLLKEIGFSEAMGTRNGGMLAQLMFKTYSGDNRPGDLAALDSLLLPFVKEIVIIKEQISSGPMITAIK